MTGDEQCECRKKVSRVLARKNLKYRSGIVAPEQKQNDRNAQPSAQNKPAIAPARLRLIWTLSGRHFRLVHQNSIARRRAGVRKRDRIRPSPVDGLSHINETPAGGPPNAKRI